MFNKWRIDPTNPTVIGCSKCSKVFTGSQAGRNYRKHQKIHLRPHQCKECSMRFASVTDLERHEDLHSENRTRYHCPWREVCGFRGSNANRYLRHHIRIKHRRNVTSENGIDRPLKDIYRKVEIEAKKADEVFRSARECDSEGLSTALAQNMDPNMSDYHGFTPLMVVVRSQCTDSARMTAINTLLRHGADINSFRDFTNYDGMDFGPEPGHTATAIACLEGKSPTISILRMLVERGGRVNRFVGDTRVLFEGFCGYGANYEGMIQHLAAPDRVPYAHFDPFPPEHLEWTRLLLSAGILSTLDLGDLLGQFIRNGFYETVPALVKFGADVNYWNPNKTPLMSAVKQFLKNPKRWDAVIRVLLEAGAEPRLHGWNDQSPLSLAQAQGHKCDDLVRLLWTYVLQIESSNGNAKDQHRLERQQFQETDTSS